MCISESTGVATLTISQCFRWVQRKQRSKPEIGQSVGVSIRQQTGSFSIALAVWKSTDQLEAGFFVFSVSLAHPPSPVEVRQRRSRYALRLRALGAWMARKVATNVE
jgi:hypothetical protein